MEKIWRILAWDEDRRWVRSLTLTKGQKWILLICCTIWDFQYSVCGQPWTLEEMEPRRARSIDETSCCRMTKVPRMFFVSWRFSTGAICAFIALILASLVSAREDVRVVRFSPNTPADANSNIEIEFDRRMVPLGRKLIDSEAAPATIEPELNCSWRWVGDRTLLCETSPGAPLRLATEFTITVHPGLISEDGSSLKQKEVHQFTTAVVELRNARIEEFKTPGTPVLEVRFSQPVKREDIEAHVFLKFSDAPDGFEDPALVRVDAGPAWNSEVAFFTDTMWVKYSFYDAFQDDRENSKSWHDYELKDDFDFGKVALERWRVKPIDELPEGAKFDLVVERMPSIFGLEVRETVQAQGGFRTLGRFEFLGVECTNPHEGRIKLDVRPSQMDEPPSESETCKSETDIFFRFSAPVRTSEIARKIEVTTNGGKVEPRDGALRGDYDQHSVWVNDYDQGFGTVRAPWVWQPNTKYTVTDEVPESNGVASNASRVRDIYGRELEAGVHQSFQTSHLAPYLSIGSRWKRYAVLELETDSEIAVYSTNMAEIPLRYRLLRSGGRLVRGVTNLRPPALEDVRQVSPLGIREILGNKPGAFFVRTSVDHDEGQELFGQVTPYSAHAKIGYFDSLIWVTDLNTGRGVPNARVEMLRGDLKTLRLEESRVVAHTDDFGIASLPGIRRLSPKGIRLDTRQSKTALLRVTGRKGVALLPLIKEFRTDLWPEYPVASSIVSDYRYLDAWGTSSQGVYRRGDTVRFKIYLRGQDNIRHTLPPSGMYELTVEDPLLGEGAATYQMDFKPDEFGAVHGEFRLPDSAVLGWYRFVVRPKLNRLELWSILGRDLDIRQLELERTPMHILVADFTPASFSVSTELDRDQYSYGSMARAKTFVRLHSGGVLAGAHGQVNVHLQEREFIPPRTAALPYQFATDSWYGEREILNVQSVTDASGEITSEVQLDDAEPAYARLWATGIVADERGRDVYAKSPYAEYFGVDRYVGIKIDSWTFKAQQESEIEALVVDRSGSPVEDVDVKVTIERRLTNTARFNSFDRVYRSDGSPTWEEVLSCQGRATKTSFVCKYTPEEAGLLQISATCASETLRCSSVSAMRTVTGPGAIVWEGRSGQQLDLALNSDKFEAGDTAEVLVPNPFPEALALVSIERYGILDSWSTVLEDSFEVIKVPIKPEYHPQVYVSIVAAAPRLEGGAVDSSEDADDIDLGKPDFRWGTAVIAAEAHHKRIAIEVLTDKQNYKPREKVTARLSARPLTSESGREPIEFAVSVLDEAVLDLIQGDADYFDPYAGFAGFRELGIDNYNLLSQLIDRKYIEEGKRTSGELNFAFAASNLADSLESPVANSLELEADPLELRTISKYVSYWNPSIVADQQGNASFEFTLPDNVTGWRILALASTPTDRFGLGQKSITARTLTEIRAATPNQLNAGDRFDANFVVVNHMKEERKLDVEIVAIGAVKGERAVAQESLFLAPDARSTVRIQVDVDSLPDVPSGRALGEISFEVRARDELDSDGLVHKVPVRQIRRREFVSTFGSVESNSMTETVEFPEDVVDSSIELEISASPTILGNLAPAFRSMRDYPYRSAEQALSSALFAAHYEVFKSRLDDQIQWRRRHVLLRTFLSGLSRYQAPGGGFAYWIPLDTRMDFYLSAYMGVGLSVLESMGYVVPEDVGTRLDHYLMKTLREGVALNHYSGERHMSAQALALDALARSQKTNLNVAFLSRYLEGMESANAFALANLLSAAIRTRGAESLAEKAWALLLNRSSRTDETLHFEETMDPLSGIAGASRLESNCAVLSALVSAYEAGRDLANARDIDGIARWIRNSGGIAGRNTRESVLCLLALSDYARVQESSDPELRIEISLGIGEFSAERLGEKEFRAFSDAPLVLRRFVPKAQEETQGKLRFVADGSGRVHYGTRMSYVPIELPDEAIRSGLGVIREYSVKQGDGWRLLDSGTPINKGDTVRVDLYLDVPATRSFVVMDDPVPGGLEPINQSLATIGEFQDLTFDGYPDPRSHFHSAPFWEGFRPEGLGFYHRELGHGNVVFYSELLTARRYRLTWFGKAVASGTFRAPRARVEQMHSPEIFGTSTRFELTVVD